MCVVLVLLKLYIILSIVCQFESPFSFLLCRFIHAVRAKDDYVPMCIRIRFRTKSGDVPKYTRAREIIIIKKNATIILLLLIWRWTIELSCFRHLHFDDWLIYLSFYTIRSVHGPKRSNNNKNRFRMNSIISRGE